MLELDLGVALALFLSVASAVLCVAYGLTHWNADDDRPDAPPDQVRTATESRRIRNGGPAT